MADRMYDNKYRRIKGISSKWQLLQLSQRAISGAGNILCALVLQNSVLCHI